MKKTISAMLISLSSLFSSLLALASSTWEDQELIPSILANEAICEDHYDNGKIYLNPGKIYVISVPNNGCLLGIL